MTIVTNCDKMLCATYQLSNSKNNTIYYLFECIESKYILWSYILLILEKKNCLFYDHMIELHNRGFVIN